jgi:hypothetical protein
VLCRHGLSVSLVRCETSETSETRRMRSIGLLLVHVPQAQRHTCLALRTLHPTNPMEFVFLRIGKGCSNLVDLESWFLSILTSCSLVSLLSILFSLALLPLSSWEPFERVVLHNRSTAGFRRKHDPAQRVKRCQTVFQSLWGCHMGSSIVIVGQGLPGPAAPPSSSWPLCWDATWRNVMQREFQ